MVVTEKKEMEKPIRFVQRQITSGPSIMGGQTVQTITLGCCPICGKELFKSTYGDFGVHFDQIEQYAFEYLHDSPYCPGCGNRLTMPQMYTVTDYTVQNSRIVEENNNG